MLKFNLKFDKTVVEEIPVFYASHLRAEIFCKFADLSNL